MKVTITKNKVTSEYEARRGQTILTFLQMNRIGGVEAPCGGMGRCGFCAFGALFAWDDAESVK